MIAPPVLRPAPDQLAPATGAISVCIVCRNEADRLASCLDSVNWADEVLVMDLASCDGSAQVAAARGVRVITRAPHPIVEPLRNELAAQARGAWVLALDPDEQVTPGLARALRQLAQREDLDAIVIPRMNWDLGYPPTGAVQRYEPQLRMYRRDRIVWPEVPNALPTVPDARVFRLAQRDENVLIHNRNRTVPEALERAMRYAPAQAQSMVAQGEVFSARRMLAALAAQVDKEFFRGRAWEDGVPGVLRAGILVAYKFYVWAAFWQLAGASRTEADDRFVRRLGRLLAGLRRLAGLPGAGVRLLQALRRR